MNPICGRQATCLLLVILSGWSLTMTAENGRDGWIVLLIACLLSLPLAALCCLPSERMPMVGWFSLPRVVFGSGFGTAYLLFLSVFSFISLLLAVTNSIVFLRTVSGGVWPVWLLTAVILLCAAYTASGGIERLVLWTEPVIWVVVFFLALSLVLSWRQLDLTQLLPLLGNGAQGLPNRVFLLLSVPFGEVFYAAAALGNRGTQIRPGLLRACVLAGILLTLLYIRNICLLGANGAAAVLYPSYTAAGVLELGESFQRGEVIISGSLIVCAVARIALLLDFLSESLSTAVKTGTKKQHILCAAVVTGVLCVYTAGSNRSFTALQELWQLLFLPIVLLAAGALYLGVYCYTKKS